MKKILILDSGPLINLSINGLLYIYEKLKKTSSIEIVITDKVYDEVVKRPSNIPRFELGALRVKALIDDKIIKFPKEIGINQQELEKETDRLLGLINCSLQTGNNEYVNIVSPAEVSCLALSLLLSKKDTENLIGIDERTTRILFEKPENLEKIMSEKLHRRVIADKDKIQSLGQFRFIRSSELVYVAYKKGLIGIEDKKALEALLYATKYKGSSISWEEIDELKKL